jgi:hypothetical protein
MNFVTKMYKLLRRNNFFKFSIQYSWQLLRRLPENSTKSSFKSITIARATKMSAKQIATSFLTFSQLFSHYLLALFVFHSFSSFQCYGPVISHKHRKSTSSISLKFIKKRLKKFYPRKFHKNRGISSFFRANFVINWT